MKDSKIRVKVEKIIAKYSKKKKEKNKNIAKNKYILKDKKHSDIMNVFHIFRFSFKFSTSFKLKVSASCSTFKVLSKSKAHVSRIKIKNIDLHKTFSIIIKEGFAMSGYSFRLFLILNHDLNVHIVNDIM